MNDSSDFFLIRTVCNDIIVLQPILRQCIIVTDERAKIANQRFTEVSPQRTCAIFQHAVMWDLHQQGGIPGDGLCMRTDAHATFMIWLNNEITELHSSTLLIHQSTSPFLWQGLIWWGEKKNRGWGKYMWLKTKKRWKTNGGGDIWEVKSQRRKKKRTSTHDRQDW